MKTLSKIRIKDENILKNDDLKNLKGGEGMCYCYTGDYMNLLYSSYTGSEESCNDICWTLFFGQFGDVEYVYSGF
jgi:hypothetical protein